MTQYVRDPDSAGDLLPSDTSIPVWRYQDLTKFVWMLATSCLWFARADTLGDAYEGSSTRAFKDSLRILLKAFKLGRSQPRITRLNRALVRNAAVNCWHMSEHESAAMWQLYAASGQGIAIRSTIERLMKSFPERKVADTGRDASGAANVIGVEFGAVRYIDHKMDDLPRLGGTYKVTDPFFLKPRSFEHEREFRALLWDLRIPNNTLDLDGTVFPYGGVAVPVNLELLIESIYISPGAQPWYRQVVEAIVERFAVGSPLVQSRLDEDPIF